MSLLPSLNRTGLLSMPGDCKIPGASVLVRTRLALRKRCDHSINTTSRSAKRSLKRPQPSSDETLTQLFLRPLPSTNSFQLQQRPPLFERTVSGWLVYPRQDTNERCGKVYSSGPAPALYKFRPNLCFSTTCSNQANACVVVRSAPFT